MSVSEESRSVSALRGHTVEVFSSGVCGCRSANPLIGMSAKIGVRLSAA